MVEAVGLGAGREGRPAGGDGARLEEREAGKGGGFCGDRGETGERGGGGGRGDGGGGGWRRADGQLPPAAGWQPGGHCCV